MSAPTEDVNMGNTAQEGGQDSATPASTAVAAEQQPATSGDGQAATETDGQPETAANCEVGKKRKVADVDDSADAKEGVSGDISQADAKEAAGKTHDGSGSSDSDSDKGSDSDSDNDTGADAGVNADADADADAGADADADDDDAEDSGPEVMEPPPRELHKIPLRMLSLKLLDTYRHINKVYYEERSKKKQSWDDKSDNYIIKAGELFNDRFLFKKQVGKGSFGVVAKAVDQKKDRDVALKIIKSQRPFAKQAQVEIRILKFMKERNTDGKYGVVNLLEYFTHRQHVCLVFEYLGQNLYDIIKATDFKGLPLTTVQDFGRQLLHALSFLSREDIQIIHCDLKPENILLCPDGTTLKIIDFGSSCFCNNKMYEYIQSRFYRSPEVMLGISYDMSIDMWSLGCILFELHTGIPLFGGQSEKQQMTKICGLLGLPPRKMMLEAKPAKRSIAFETIKATTTSEDAAAASSESDFISSLVGPAAAVPDDSSSLGGGHKSSSKQTEGDAADASGTKTGDGSSTASDSAAAKSDEAVPQTPKAAQDSSSKNTEQYKLRSAVTKTSLEEQLRIEKGGPRGWRTNAAEAAVVYKPFMHFLHQTLIFTPADRIKPDTALKHPFITGEEMTEDTAADSDASSSVRPFSPASGESSQASPEASTDVKTLKTK